MRASKVSRRRRVIGEMKLIIENVRTFVGRHELPIRPLTILTGENSSGKTTLLACLASVTATGFPFDPGFNEEPYRLGLYDSIVAKARPKGRNEFSLGLVQDSGPDGEPMEVTASFTSLKGAPMVSKVNLVTPEGVVSLEYKEGAKRYGARLRSRRLAPALEAEFPFRAPRKNGEKEEFRSSLYSQLLTHSLQQERKSKPVQRELVALAADMASHSVITTRSVAPIRTKPWRTYDPADYFYDPEGDHIPFEIAKEFGEKNSTRLRGLKRALESFGKESGLFERIEVKSLGKNGTEPFQLQVLISGKPMNLQDVGYGVSQSLPVIVESAVLPAEDLLLVQEPEVHLHPMAQAALGTFFCKLVSTGGKSFVLETHSDYLVDRVRQEVAGGTIKPEAVIVLYFERKGLETTVYALEIDEVGNLLGVPQTYRSFFLREQLNLLSRG